MRRLHNEELRDFFTNYSGDQEERGGMARSTYGGEVHTRFWWGDLRATDHLGRDCKTNYDGPSRSGLGGVDWIDATQNWDKRRDPCECGNEPSDTKKCGEFDYLMKY